MSGTDRHHNRGFKNPQLSDRTKENPFVNHKEVAGDTRHGPRSAAGSDGAEHRTEIQSMSQLERPHRSTKTNRVKRSDTRKVSTAFIQRWLWLAYFGNSTTGKQPVAIGLPHGRTLRILPNWSNRRPMLPARGGARGDARQIGRPFIAQTIRHALKFLLRWAFIFTGRGRNSVRGPAAIRRPGGQPACVAQSRQPESLSW